MDSTLASQYRAFPSNTTLYAPLQIQVQFIFSNIHIVLLQYSYMCKIFPSNTTLLGKASFQLFCFQESKFVSLFAYLLKSCSQPQRCHISFPYQVWGQFDNYLLTSVILIAVAIILLMLYISCYAWVFRVSYLWYRVFFTDPPLFHYPKENNYQTISGAVGCKLFFFSVLKIGR